MNFEKDIRIILEYAHYWNWASDWVILQDVYEAFPDSYSILTPFAYSYLEELIRSTTSEYGIEVLDENGNEIRRKVGKKLIALAKKENENNSDYIGLLNKVEFYFQDSSSSDNGNNRNSVNHGYMHLVNWTKESFENLIHDIAKISPYNRF